MQMKSSLIHVLMERLVRAVYFASSRWGRRQKDELTGMWLSCASEATLLSPVGDADVMPSHGLHPSEELIVELGNVADPCNCYDTLPGCVSFCAGLAVTRSSGEGGDLGRQWLGKSGFLNPGAVDFVVDIVGCLAGSLATVP